MYTTDLPKRLTFYCRPLFLIIFFLAPKASSALELNGLSAHTELNKTLYIGALYTEKPTSDEEAIRALSSGKMEIRINSKRISSRKFNKLLVEALAINNSEELFSKHIDDVVKLSQIAKDNLQEGDRITITADASAPVTVLLNDKKLTSFENASFFNLLLNIWVGEVPPSSNFKSDILAGGQNVSQTLLEQFQGLQPDSSRGNLAALWNKPPTPPVKNTAKPAPTQPKPAPIQEQKRVVQTAAKPSPKPTQPPLPAIEREEEIVTAVPTIAPKPENDAPEPPPTEQAVALNTTSDANPTLEENAITSSAEELSANEEPQKKDELEERREKNKRFLQSMRRR